MTIKTTSTLLELVQNISASPYTDEQVVTLVAYLINSGRVRLCGTFAGAKIGRHAAFASFVDTFAPPLATAVASSPGRPRKRSGTPQGKPASPLPALAHSSAAVSV